MNRLNKIFLLIIIASIVFYLFGAKAIFQNHSEKKENLEYLNLFSRVAALVEKEYVEQVQPDEKYPNAFSAMVNSLDPLSAYLNPRETSIFNLFCQNLAYGIGVFGIKAADYFYITDVVEHSPAQQAGIIPGQRIKSINGHSIFAKSFWEMVLSFKTRAPEMLSITLINTETNNEKIIKCGTALLNNRTSIQKIEQDTYLLKLRRIDESGVNLLKDRLPTGRILKMIIDLRKYAGGNFKSFKQLSGLFFEKMEGFCIQTKNSRQSFTLGSESPLQYKAVVIINSSTMIYNEFLAALFNLYSKKTTAIISIIGSKTNGLIFMPKHILLEDGSSLLLTEGKFMFHDKNIFKTGVKPHIPMKRKDWQDVVDRSISVLNRN